MLHFFWRPTWKRPDSPEYPAPHHSELTLGSLPNHCLLHHPPRARGGAVPFAVGDGHSGGAALVEGPQGACECS